MLKYKLKNKLEKINNKNYKGDKYYFKSVCIQFSIYIQIG